MTFNMESGTINFEVLSTDMGSGAFSQLTNGFAMGTLTLPNTLSLLRLLDNTVNQGGGTQEAIYTHNLMLGSALTASNFDFGLAGLKIYYNHIIGDGGANFVGTYDGAARIVYFGHIIPLNLPPGPAESFLNRVRWRCCCSACRCSCGLRGAHATSSRKRKPRPLGKILPLQVQHAEMLVQNFASARFAQACFRTHLPTHPPNGYRKVEDASLNSHFWKNDRRSQEAFLSALSITVPTKAPMHLKKFAAKRAQIHEIERRIASAVACPRRAQDSSRHAGLVWLPPSMPRLRDKPDAKVMPRLATGRDSSDKNQPHNCQPLTKLGKDLKNACIQFRDL